jgi:hypothetical protein
LRKAPTYNTNLASEFWVLSALYRIGVDAHLTLGNKKAVDIVIIKDSEIIYTVDVKGVVGPYDWPADNIKELVNQHHIYVLVCFENKILNPASNPSIWIIPSTDLKNFMIKYSTRTVVSRSLIRKNGISYKDNWRLFNKDV